MGETLALEWLEGPPPGDAPSAEAWFDGEWMKVGVQKSE
jgi:hypothetical protein